MRGAGSAPMQRESRQQGIWQSAWGAVPFGRCQKARTLMNSAIVAQRPTATLAQPPAGFVRRHPVLSYYLLTFAISWRGFLLVGSPGLLSGTDCQTDPLFPVALLALLAGPAAAGLILTGRISEIGRAHV